MPDLHRRRRLAAAPSSVLAAIALLAWPGPSAGQLPLKPDGQWRAQAGVGLSFSRGNSRSRSSHLDLDAGRQTDQLKFTLDSHALFASDSSGASAHHAGVGTRLDRELGGHWFVYGSAEWFRDRLANLKNRFGLASGLGRHLYRKGSEFWDVFAAPGYTIDYYTVPTRIDDVLRRSFDRFEVQIGTEAQIQVAPNTRFNQKLLVMPAIARDGGLRGTFDLGLNVDMTHRIAMTMNLTVRYNSDPGAGLRRSDTQFVSGLAFKLD